MKILWALVFVPALAGCVTQQTYQWGSYEHDLYASYKDTTKTEKLKLNLVAHISSMEKSNQKVAPGLYAELGTLYLQSGDSVNAIGMYSKEADAWPESKGLMAALISNIKRREANRVASKEVAK